MGYNKNSEFDFILFHFLTSLFLWKNPGTVWSTAPGFFHAASRRWQCMRQVVYRRYTIGHRSVSFPLSHLQGAQSMRYEAGVQSLQRIPVNTCIYCISMISIVFTICRIFIHIDAFSGMNTIFAYLNISSQYGCLCAYMSDSSHFYLQYWRYR